MISIAGEMKQSKIFQFFNRDNSISNSNFNVSGLSDKTTATHALKRRNITLDNHSKDEQDKENQKQISMKDKQSFEISSLTTKLTPVIGCIELVECGESSTPSTRRKTSKEISTEQNDSGSDMDEDIEMIYDQTLDDAGQKERKLMENQV